MAKIIEAKLIKVDTDRTKANMLFMKSNYCHIPNWQPKEVLDGFWNVGKKTFQSGDRTFKVLSDYTAVEETK